MLGVGKSLINYGKIDSLSQVYEKVNQISAEQLLEIANEVFDEKQLSMLTYQAKN